MSRSEQIARHLLVVPGKKANLAARDTAWRDGPEFEELSAKKLTKEAKERLAKGIEALSDAQDLLWASDTYSLLIVFQAMDAAGKDSTIKHVMSGVNPAGVNVVSFKTPSSEELDHNYLWRIWKAVPSRGQIGIFNRSHYEEVIAVRVHPEWLAAQKLPPGDRGREFWKERFDHINAFEHHLVSNGTKIIKFFLNVSKAEQKRRFLDRLDKPHKHWKFSAADVAERAHWDDYMKAFEEAITATSTPWAPWYVVPADNKPVMQAMVAAIIVDAIDELHLQWPTVSDAARAEHATARAALEAEQD